MPTIHNHVSIDYKKKRHDHLHDNAERIHVHCFVVMRPLKDFGCNPRRCATDGHCATFVNGTCQSKIGQLCQGKDITILKKSGPVLTLNIQTFESNTTRPNRPTQQTRIHPHNPTQIEHQEHQTKHQQTNTHKKNLNYLATKVFVQQ